MLSFEEIISLRDKGLIKIEPFHKEQLNTNSYDVTIGPYIARYKDSYGLKKTSKDTSELFKIEYKGEEGYFTIAPNESILCHTNEFIGGISDDALGITTKMHATSTAGRLGLTACRCAGLGDVGYINRWTIEMQNNSPFHFQIEVGSIIAQISFHEVHGSQKHYRDLSGNYQKEKEFEIIKNNWHPTMMIPKSIKVTNFWRGLYGNPCK
jgi:dCTP deaminase